jgi:quinol monooxygenase YgiN
MPKSEEVVVVVHFTAKPGKEKELLDSMRNLLEPTRKEAGCIRYELNQEIENPRAFTFAEKFAGRQAKESASGSCPSK